MEFDEEQEGHEEEMEIPAAPPGYDSLGNSGRSRIGGTVGAEGGASAITPTRKGGPTGSVRYRECQKNHAVSIGGQAVDGCGDFMAAGEEGTLDALKCAACNCHRNFHRKEIDGETTPYQQQPVPQPHHQYHHQFSQYYGAQPPSAGYLHHHLTTPPQYRPLALPAATSGGGTSRDEEDMSNPSSSGGGGVAGSGGGGGSGTRKRFRTKFTPEQREKMLAFAEQLGWRIQKHDEAAVEQFCEETGVKRQVLKVWMHNNKHTIGKKP